ncbi:hypothetical protein FACS1894153_3840 [Bacteroidia bacterium]|nr:hypothetical protein FACS1894153_3840 [Bacteroidia bacterium]
MEHAIESVMEKIERGIYGNKAVDDPIYDMHYSNAKSFLNTINSTKSTQTEITIPIYYQGGHK